MTSWYIYYFFKKYLQNRNVLITKVRELFREQHREHRVQILTHFTWMILIKGTLSVRDTRFSQVLAQLYLCI